MDGNDGTKSKDPATDASTTGGSTSGGSTSGGSTAGGSTAGGSTAGTRRLETTKTPVTSTSGADDKVTTNPDDYYLPMKSYQQITWAVPVLDAVHFFFKNSKTATCGITKCELLLPGCKAPYTGTKLSIQDAYPYTLSALVNIDAGYQDKFCFKCENAKSTIA